MDNRAGPDRFFARTQSRTVTSFRKKKFFPWTAASAHAWEFPLLHSLPYKFQACLARPYNMQPIPYNQS
jgi:hypothetical protein